MNSPPPRIPTRVDLVQMGRQAHAFQRSTRASSTITIPSNLKLLDQLSYVCRARHYSYRTEEAYLLWVRKFILFHDKQHPSTLGEPAVRAFIDYLSVDKACSASTVRQALNAIVFFYREVLKIELPWIDGLVTPKRPVYIPVVFSQREVREILTALQGTWRLIAQILYGSGLRINEALELHIEKMKAVWLDDKSSQREGVFIPAALERKYKGAGKEWPWFWVFPSKQLSIDPRSRVRRRHHVYDQSFSRATLSVTVLPHT
jgi:integrase